MSEDRIRYETPRQGIARIVLAREKARNAEVHAMRVDPAGAGTIRRPNEPK